MEMEPSFIIDAEALAGTRGDAEASTVPRLLVTYDSS